MKSFIPETLLLRHQIDLLLGVCGYKGRIRANTFTGEHPDFNDKKDGFVGAAPVWFYRAFAHESMDDSSSTVEVRLRIVKDSPEAIDI